MDQSGAVVPGATVSVANQATGLNRRSATTNSNGDYVFSSLIPGAYRVTVEAQGFKKATQENVLLAAGESRELQRFSIVCELPIVVQVPNLHDHHPSLPFSPVRLLAASP